MRASLFLAALLATCISITAYAASFSKTSGDQGYWVIETHISTPKNATVYFYTNDHTLVYKEQVKNVRLNLKKKIIQQSLEKVLSQSIAAYRTNMKAKQDEQLLTKLVSKK